MSSKLFLRTYTLIMLSGQSGLFPLLPWSRLPLSCGCHQCSWWSWSCHAWCCVANVAATWQLQLQNDHVFFTGFYPFWAIYGCYRHWLLNGNGHILKFWAPEWETFCSSRCLHHSSCWGILVQCLAQHPKHLWRWVIVRVQVSERAVSSVWEFVLFVAYKDFLLHFVPLTLFLFWLSWSKKFDTLWSYHDFKILQARFWMLLAVRPF